MSWDVYLWKTPTTDQGFVDTATEALEDDLSSQLNFSINVSYEGETPQNSQDCSSGYDMRSWFSEWLDDNDLYTEGAHHMVLVDCVTSYSSNSIRSVKHNPSDYGNVTYPFATSVANVAVGLLGPNRFRNTVIHEFTHTAMDDSNCPLGPGDEHSCGGVFSTLSGDRISPMLTSYENDYNDSNQCIAEASTGGGFTTTITSCTEDALEDYHANN